MLATPLRTSMRRGVIIRAVPAVSRSAGWSGTFSTATTSSSMVVAPRRRREVGAAVVGPMVRLGLVAAISFSVYG